MPTQLSIEDHIEVLTRSGAALRKAAARAGFDAKVPTCPAWNVTALVAHQGMVHRWAAAHLRRDRSHRTQDSMTEAAAAPDLLAWYSDGLDALIDTLGATPDDAEAMVFLMDAPPPRRFWARRQAHETTPGRCGSARTRWRRRLERTRSGTGGARRCGGTTTAASQSGNGFVRPARVLVPSTGWSC